MRRIPCPVSAEELSRLYKDGKLIDQEIVDLLGHGATLKRVRSWRRRFGIETLLRSTRNEVSPIEGTLRSLLIGSMLGDGRLVRTARSSSYTECHSLRQRQYLEWKFEQWGSWQAPSGIRPRTWIVEGKRFPGCAFNTLAHPSLIPWHDTFYPEPGPKQLRPSIVDIVDPMAFAIWYMDDGSASWWPLITFGMNACSRRLARSVFERFDFDPRWVSTSGLTGQFIFDGEEQAERFISLVKPHMPECMHYKLEFGFKGRYYEIRSLAPEAELRRMAGDRIPIRQMAKLLDLSASVVSRRLQKLGIVHHRTVGRPPVGPYQV